MFVFVFWLLRLCFDFCVCVLTFAFVFWLLRLCFGFCVCVLAFAFVFWLLHLCFGFCVCVLHLWATVENSSDTTSNAANYVQTQKHLMETIFLE